MFKISLHCVGSSMVTRDHDVSAYDLEAAIVEAVDICRAIDCRQKVTVEAVGDDEYIVKSDGAMIGSLTIVER